MVPSFNANAQNLRMMFTQVAVTLENAETTFRRPVGPMVMQGLLNQNALGDLDLLFTSDPSTPAQVALLPGFHQQMRELARWVTNMLDAQQRNDVVAIHVDQMRILYILEGAQGANVLSLNLAKQPGVVGAGDGFGLLPSGTDCQANQSSCGYLAAIRTIVERLSTQGVVTDLTRQNLLTTLKTLEALAYNIQQQALSLLGFTTLDAPTLQSLALCTTQIDAMLNGVDRDGDSSSDAVPGEAAAAQLYTYMQQVGAIKLMSANT